MFLEGRWATWDGAVPYGALTEALGRGLRRLKDEEIDQLVGAYRQDLARLLPEVATHLDESAGVAHLSQEERQLRLDDGVATLITSLAQRQPLVLFLDDLHLAPQMRLQLHVARRLKESRLLIVYAYREHELSERPALVAGRHELIRSRMSTDIRLAPFTESQTGDMIAHAFGSAVATQLRAPIYAINRGNPFFVEEVLRYLVENKAVRRVDDCWEVLDVAQVGIPEAVKLMVHERVDRLGDEATTILQRAAVLGREFSFAALSLVADRPESQLIEVLDQVVTAGILVDHTLPTTEERYGFREDRVRDALYETIPTPRRRRYHLQAGQALRSLQPDRFEELAYHFTHGSDITLGANLLISGG